MGRGDLQALTELRSERIHNLFQAVAITPQPPRVAHTHGSQALSAAPVG